MAPPAVIFSELIYSINLIKINVPDIFEYKKLVPSAAVISYRALAGGDVDIF